MRANRTFPLLSFVLLASTCLAAPFGFAQGVVAPTMPQAMRYAAHPVASLSGSTAIQGKSIGSTTVQGVNVPVVEATQVNPGVVITGQNGEVIVIPGSPRQEPNPSHANARELKLQIREMAEQLVSGVSSKALRGAIALPTSFVNLDNMESSSSFGRYIAEQLYHEFYQRGFPIKEYRIGCSIQMREGEGDFFLTRALGEKAVPAGHVVVAGTYYSDGQSIIVNARLVRPGDGRVLRTANMVLDANSLTRRMLARGTGSHARAALTIRDFQETIAPKSQNAIDLGRDIH